MVYFCTLMLQILSKLSFEKVQDRGGGFSKQGKGCRVILQEWRRGESKNIIFPSSWIIEAKLLCRFPVYVFLTKINLIKLLHFIQLVMYCRTGNVYYPSFYILQSKWSSIFWVTETQVKSGTNRVHLSRMSKCSLSISLYIHLWTLSKYDGPVLQCSV